MYHFSWFELLGGPFHAVVDFLEHTAGMDPEGAHAGAIAIFNSWAVALFLVVLALFARRGLAAARAAGGTLQYVPADNLGARNLLEIFTESIFNLAHGMLPTKDAKRHFWLIGGLFIYILFGNLLGVIPGGLPFTDNLNNNLAMALTVFVVFNVAGIARNGFGYIKHMAGPVWWLGWLILPIELVGIAVRPLSLSLRLMGNIYGDHMVFGVMSDMVPVIVPSLFLGLGIFVSFLQAFVFTLLTIIYISLSLGDEDGHH